MPDVSTTSIPQDDAIFPISCVNLRAPAGAAFKADHASMAQGCRTSLERLDARLAQLPRP